MPGEAIGLRPPAPKPTHAAAAAHAISGAVSMIAETAAAGTFRLYAL